MCEIPKETYNLCFFFERGEIMGNETINHVLQVEETVAKIREDAQLKIRQINMEKQDKIDTINNNFEQELRAYKESKKHEFEERLLNTKKENKESIQQVAKDYEQAYNQKKDQMTDYIVKEVLKRYGS